MKPCIVIILGIILIAGLYSPAHSHMINYQVENKGISVRIFYSVDEPASYSAYEIFGPNDAVPHKKGRTDKNGFVSFLPDRAGNWIVKVSGESDHGFHGTQIEIKVNDSLFMESFKKPLMSQFAMLIAGTGFICGIFGIWALWRAKKGQHSA